MNDFNQLCGALSSKRFLPLHLLPGKNRMCSGSGSFGVQIACTPNMPHTSRHAFEAHSIEAVEAVLEEARMELSVGQVVLDEHLAERLMQIAKDTALPVSHRSQALTLLCRFG